MNECPILPELLNFPVDEERVNIIEQIGTKYYEFGIYLLQDNDGNKMDTIIADCRGVSFDINRQILCKWIRGGGKQPVTWATLVTEIDRCGLTELAKTIRKEKSKR